MKGWLPMVFTFATSPLLAETVPIIAGQQADFNRFVATIPIGTQWTSQNLDGVFMLQLPDELTFDASSLAVQEADDQDGIRVAQPKNNEIAITYDCDCEGSTFVYRDVFLVIDIREASPSTTDPITALPTQAMDGSWWRNRLSTRAEATLPEVAIEQDFDIASAENDIFISERLARELSSATLNGRTEVRQESMTKTEASIDSTSNESKQENPIRIGISASQNSTVSQDTPSPAAPCREFRTQRIFAPENDQPNYQTIIDSRSSIYSEIGQPDQSRVVDLAIDYLRLAMGTEALLVLQELPAASDEADLVKQIANLLTGSKDRSDYWKSARDCQNSLRFWSVFDGSTMGGEVQTDILLLYYKAAPIWLQSALYERLDEFLRDHDQVSAADELRAFNDLKTAQEADSDSDAQSRKPQATGLQVANRDQPEKMIDLLASDSTQDMVRRSEAIRFEHQDTVLWLDLMEAEITADLRENRLSSALTKLTEVSSNEVPPADIARIADKIFTQISESASDTDFLAAYFRRDDWALSRDVLKMLDDRLVTFQLPEISNPETEIQPSLEPVAVNAAENSEPTGTAPESIATELNSAAIRTLLTDTQDLRSSVVELLSTRTE